jgi:hypothetical protein
MEDRDATAGQQRPTAFNCRKTVMFRASAPALSSHWPLPYVKARRGPWILSLEKKMKKFLALAAVAGVMSTAIAIPEASASPKSYCRGYAKGVANTYATRNAIGGAVIGGIGGALIGGAVGGWTGAQIGAAVGGVGGVVVGGSTWQHVYNQAYWRCRHNG